MEAQEQDKETVTAKTWIASGAGSNSWPSPDKWLTQWTGGSELKYLAETKLPCPDFLWSLSWCLLENHKDGDPVLKDCLVRYCWKEAGGKTVSEEFRALLIYSPHWKKQLKQKVPKGLSGGRCSVDMINSVPFSSAEISRFCWGTERAMTLCTPLYLNTS